MKYRIIITFLLFFMMGVFTISSAVHAAAPPPRPAPEPAAVSLTPGADIDPLKGLVRTAEEAGLKGANPPSVAEFAGRILGGVLALVGILFLALMIYGGIRWMLARGNQEDVAHAKDTVAAAIIGLIVVSLGYVLTTFIFNILQSAAGTA